MYGVTRTRSFVNKIYYISFLFLTVGHDDSHDDEQGDNGGRSLKGTVILEFLKIIAKLALLYVLKGCD